jgi:radical SAM superfamily enzyme with C-terminal helix-hairpin-helix motif
MIIANLKTHETEYDYYIDSLRNNINLWKNIGSYDLIIVVSGMTVPGKYVGGSPATLNEIQKIGENFQGFKILGGPIKLGYSLEGKSKAKPVALSEYDIFCYGDIEAVIDHYLSTGEIDAL